MIRCPRCGTTIASFTAAAYGHRGVRAALVRAASAHRARCGRWCEVCVDVEWLIGSGETHPEQVSGRVGVKPASLRRHLHRHGRADLVGRLLPAGDVRW